MAETRTLRSVWLKTFAHPLSRVDDERRRRCTYHCSACASHFASLKAFDLHRHGEHAVERYCVEPMDDRRLAPKSEAGICNVGRNFLNPRIGITVWQLAVTDAEGAQVSELPVKSSKATGPHLGTQDIGRAA